MPEDSEKEKLDQLRGLTDQAFEGIKAEMKRLKLDRGKAAYRRPLDLLEEAYLAIRYPVAAKGGASLPLLALRGAIDRSVDELVRRSPAQQKGEKRRDRILSCRPCRSSGRSRTGSSASASTCSACSSPTIRTCAASSCRKTGWGIRSARTSSSPRSTTAFRRAGRAC